MCLYKYLLLCVFENNFDQDFWSGTLDFMNFCVIIPLPPPSIHTCDSSGAWDAWEESGAYMHGRKEDGTRLDAYIPTDMGRDQTHYQ